MTGFRRGLLGGMLLVTLSLAYLFRGVIYDFIVVPLAYIVWILKIYYSIVPQGVFWVFLMLVLVVALVWNFVLEIHSSPRAGLPRNISQGQVEELAGWIQKSRSGTYFKWQLANRLGRISRRLGENPAQRDSLEKLEQPIAEYLDAGLNHSFVDFAASGTRFQRRVSPITLDPTIVVDYLESLLERDHGSRH